MPTPLKYGPKMECGPAPLKLPYAASQRFREDGNAFVHVASGNLNLTLTATTYVAGWALLGFAVNAPEVSGSYGSREFTTSATAATEYLTKVLCGCDLIWTFGDDSFVSATHRGNACDLIGVNDGTQQKTDIGTSTTDILRIIDGTGTSILVAVNPAKLQAVT